MIFNNVRIEFNENILLDNISFKSNTGVMENLKLIKYL